MEFRLAKKIDKPENEKLIEANETFYFPKTRFKFIENHKSFRPSCLHVLMGTTGSGKTTLSRSILQDLSYTKKILWYSTEESLNDFVTQNAYMGNVNYENIEFVTEEEILKRIGGETKNIKAFAHQLDWAIEEAKPEIIFFDNITTSLFYDQNKEAVNVVQVLRNVISKYKIPMFLVAHTASSIKENKWFESADMRGFRALAVRAEYVYCLFRFRIKEDNVIKLASYIYIDKSRLHSGGKEIYQIRYDVQTRSYIEDRNVNYQEFQDSIKGVGIK